MSGRRIARSLSRRPGALRGVPSSNRRRTNGRDGAHPEHVARRVVDDERDGERDEQRVRRAAVAGAASRRQTSTASDAQRGERRAESRERPARGELEPVGDVAEHGARAVADRLRDVARPAERRVEADERDAGDDRGDGEQRAASRVDRGRRACGRANVAYAASSTRRPPPSAPNRLPATATTAIAATATPRRPSSAAPSSAGTRRNVSSRFVTP